MKKYFLTPALLLSALVALFSGTLRSAEPSAQAVAVIGHAQLPVKNLPFVELRKIYLGDRQFWSQGLKVSILVPPSTSIARQVLLKKVLEKTEAQYRHYWVGKVFRNEAVAMPRESASSELAIRFVRTVPGSLAIIPASDVPEGVSVVKINGKGPGDEGYVLR